LGPRAGQANRSMAAVATFNRDGRRVILADTPG
jgi:hypothetical protein